MNDLLFISENLLLPLLIVVVLSSIAFCLYIYFTLTLFFFHKTTHHSRQTYCNGISLQYETTVITSVELRFYPSIVGSPTREDAVKSIFSRIKLLPKNSVGTALVNFTFSQRAVLCFSIREAEVYSYDSGFIGDSPVLF
jgi:hypothetical protein